MSDYLATGALPDEYQQLAKTVADFAKTVVAPVAAEHDANHTFPYEVVAGMADMGLFGLPFPEEYGGMGGDYFALCLALEELGKVDQSVAITLEAGVSLGSMPIYRFGNEAQKQEWLPQLTSGKSLAAFGLTEPGAGSDAGGTKTTAKFDSGEWIINGNKQFITNSGTDITKLVTVTAVTGVKDGGKKEISTILVPTTTPGFTAEPAYNKVGWNASDTHPLTFADVRVPEENLLGERGRGYANFLRILDEGRIAISALSSVPPRAASTSRSSTPRSARRSVAPSDTTRPSRSRSRVWRLVPTSHVPRTTTRPHSCCRASRSRSRRPSPS